MSAIELAFRAAVADLDRIGRPYALVGGFAVAARANPRFTLDIDLAVAVDHDAGAEAVIRALHDRGYLVLATVEQEATGRLATARLRPPKAADVVVDLLFASSAIEPEIAGGAERLEVLPGLLVPVASIAHLLAMKLLARDDRDRPADADDLRHLSAVATDDDWAVAAEAVALIEDRGAHRGRSLTRLLAELRAAH